MIRATIGIFSQGGVSFDADYQAVLDYATTQGYTLPSASQQALQNQLVVDLKDAGIWSKLDTFGVFATDGDSDFALIDWIRLTDYTAINSPTFTTNAGYNSDGSTSYIDSGFLYPADLTNGSQNDNHAMTFIDSLDNSGGAFNNQATLGVYITSISGIYIMQFRDNQIVVWNYSNSSSLASTFSLNYLATDRSSSSNYDIIQDTTTTNFSTTSVVMANKNMPILARSINGVINWHLDSTIKMRVVSWGASIDGLHGHYKTALDNYFNAL